MTPAFIKWAGKQLKPFRDRIEAHQRQKRFARLLRVDPHLRAAHAALERDRKRHAPTRQDIAAKQAAVHSMLRGRAVM